MKNNTMQSLNDFYSGHMVIDRDRKIIFCNSYICDLSGKTNDQLINSLISTLFSKASTIFIDSYIYPLLINESIVQESQMSWVSKNGQSIPVVVNIKLGMEGTSFWSIYECANRDKLYNELIIAKEKLEKQSEELYLLATTDPLTGLLNRREFLIRVKKITKQVERNASTLAVLSIDADLFKQINDTHGHKFGDTILKNLASMLNENRRANDLVSRVGGEEFILLLPDINKENAFTVAEQLRIKIANKKTSGIGLTVSIGLSVSKKNTRINFDTLLDLSDKALFSSKKSGRNTTTIAHY